MLAEYLNLAIVFQDTTHAVDKQQRFFFDDKTGSNQLLVPKHWHGYLSLVPVARFCGDPFLKSCNWSYRMVSQKLWRATKCNVVHDLVQFSEKMPLYEVGRVAYDKYRIQVKYIQICLVFDSFRNVGPHKLFGLHMFTLTISFKCTIPGIIHKNPSIASLHHPFLNASMISWCCFYIPLLNGTQLVSNFGVMEFYTGRLNCNVWTGFVSAVQSGARSIAKLVCNSSNYSLWYL